MKQSRPNRYSPTRCLAWALSLVALALAFFPAALAQRTPGGPAGPIIIMGPSSSSSDFQVERQIGTTTPPTYGVQDAVLDWTNQLWAEYIGTQVTLLQCVNGTSQVDAVNVSMEGPGYCIEINRTVLDTLEWYMHWPNCIAPVTSAKASIHPDSGPPTGSSPTTVPAAFASIDPNQVFADGNSCEKIRLQVDW